LSHNSLGFAAMVPLRTLLEQSSSLTTLTLRKCSLSTSCVLELSHGIDANVTLTTLDISNNQITD
jgi:hypothetical protein